MLQAALAGGPDPRLHHRAGKLRARLSGRLCVEVRRVTLEQAAGTTPDPCLERVPPEGAYLWDAFWQLERTRQSQGGFGPATFTYQEIEAASRLLDLALRPWEVRILVAMDAARRAVYPGSQADDADGHQLTRRVSATDAEGVERLFDSFGPVIEIPPPA
ncbi:phage tail assembly chaperone [Methylobacterium nodulans]|uniref:phage tail assembly chaperone n=1 Tax=Methylobacterium nodulans TaxID=114616 RepID=UPI00067FDE3B|nr:hypothetical protein [Methylobacterium nodulans]